MPHWDDTIDVSDVFHNDELSYEEIRATVVVRLRESNWLHGAGSDLADLVDELASAEDIDEFNGVWADIYDCADRDRIWIDTLG